MITYNETEISVVEKECWICGKAKKNMTRHHTLPKHLKPIKNVIIPICETCHENLNTEDVAGMISYMHKLDMTLKEVRNGFGKIKTRMNEMQEVKIVDLRQVKQ